MSGSQNYMLGSTKEGVRDVTRSRYLVFCITFPFRIKTSTRHLKYDIITIATPSGHQMTDTELNVPTEFDAFLLNKANQPTP